ncbi:adenylosuccinate lyase [Calditrichota bacterium LG25]
MPIENSEDAKRAFAISPLDGRYAGRLQQLGVYFSEFALMRARVQIELHFLKALDSTGLFPELNQAERQKIEFYLRHFSEDDYQRIKEIEQTLNHDVKSCEVFLRQRLGLRNPNMIHFGLTSEDVNNLAYSLLFREYLHKEQLPLLEKLLRQLLEFVKKWKDVPFPARTHGQMASPTTAGKELAVYLNRLGRVYKDLKGFRFPAKLNGATGNFSAFKAAFAEYDWLTFSRNFLQELGFEANLVTTQIEDHDGWARYLSLTKLLDNIVLDLDRDMWLYLTLGYFLLETDPGAVGSSTMPHKVNPINFENSEGNLQVALALINGITDKLGNSRLQRDLSDSTVTRNIGVALAHGHLALMETLRGLSRLQVNRDYCLNELKRHPELLAEPIQTILRREGVEDPYNLLKEMTRGRTISEDDLQKFIEGLPVREEVKQELLALDVTTYVGEASRICQLVIDEVEKAL